MESIIDYKPSIEKENILLCDQDELDSIFVSKLEDFFRSFISAVDNENTELLQSLLEESQELSKCKKSGTLPSFCFSIQIANSFIKSFQKEFYSTLYKYTIHIFQNIYISNFCSVIDNFIPTKLLIHLWDCLSFSNIDEIHMIIQMIKEIMKSSNKAWLYFHKMIRDFDYFKKINVKIHDPDYIDLLREYIYFLTKDGRKFLNEFDTNICYFIIWDIFNQFIECAKENDYDIKKIPDYEFRKSTVLTLMKAFKQIVSIDKFFYRRRTFDNTVCNFFNNEFIHFNDFDIYANGIRTLSFLCDLKFRPITDEYTDSKVHLKFEIFFEKEDLISKLLVDLADTVKIPFDSPFDDIPGHICNIIHRLSIQIRDNIDDQTFIHDNLGIYYSLPHHLIMESKSIENIIHTLENRDVMSKFRTCKLVSYILDGPSSLVNQILHLKMIIIVASFLESDDISLINISLKIFEKIIFSVSKGKIFYPVKDDIEECNLIELLDQIVLVDDDEKRYELTTPRAQELKNKLLKEILEAEGDPDE